MSSSSTTLRDTLLAQSREIAKQGEILHELTPCIMHLAQQMSDKWKPIETAPKDGSIIPVWRQGWGNWCLCCWKTNPRIVSAHKDGQVPEMLEDYWGDPDEMDDYYFADNNNQPTHWFLIPQPQAVD